MQSELEFLTLFNEENEFQPEMEEMNEGFGILK